MGPAFRLTKRQLRLLPLARAQHLAVLDADVDAAWQAPPTLDRIRCYMASLKSPAGGAEAVETEVLVPSREIMTSYGIPCRKMGT